MNGIFVCPGCGTAGVDVMRPECAACGRDLKKDGILDLTDAPSLDKSGGRYAHIGFDGLSTVYDRTRHIFAGVDAAVAKAINGRLGADALVLDAACGTGAVTLELAKYGRDILAGDISRNMLKELEKKTAKQGARNIVPLRMNITRLPFIDRAFDAVMAFHVFHLVAEPEKAVAEIKRVLKPGGAFFMIRNEVVSDKAPVREAVKREYYRVAEEKKAGLIEHPGWKFRNVEEGLDGLFTGAAKETIEAVSGAVYRGTPANEYFRVAERCNSDQLEIDDGAQRAIMRELDARLAAGFGKDFLKAEEEVTVSTRVILYRL